MSGGWDGKDRRAPERWRLNKEISVPDILAILFAVVGAMSVYYSIDKRVSKIEQALVQVAVDQSRQDNERSGLKAEIREGFNRLNDKFDRFIQRDSRRSN